MKITVDTSWGQGHYFQGDYRTAIAFWLERDTKAEKERAQWPE